MGQDVTLWCEVSASTNMAGCRCALRGCGGYWQSDSRTIPSKDTPHWLQFVLPIGLELRRLVFWSQWFDLASPKTIRVRVGDTLEVDTLVAEIGLNEGYHGEYRITLVDEERLECSKSSIVRLEVTRTFGQMNCQIAGLQIFAGPVGG